MSTNTQYFADGPSETLVVIDQRPMRITNAVLASFSQLQAFLTVNHPSVSAQPGGDKPHHVAQAARAGVTMS